MCRVCGKVMRDDNLKRHMSMKHAEVEQREDGDQLAAAGESIAEVEEREDRDKFIAAGESIKRHNTHFDESNNEQLMKIQEKDDACLEFELERDDGVYRKNVDIGRRVSKILSRGKILEKSLSKQNKFCLELFSQRVARARARAFFSDQVTAYEPPLSPIESDSTFPTAPFTLKRKVIDDINNDVSSWLSIWTDITDLLFYAYC